MPPVLLVCVDCGTPYSGQSDEEGTLRVEGGPGCLRCGGTNLRQITPEEISGDAVEPPSR